MVPLCPVTITCQNVKTHRSHLVTLIVDNTLTVCPGMDKFHCNYMQSVTIIGIIVQACTSYNYIISYTFIISYNTYNSIIRYNIESM